MSKWVALLLMSLLLAGACAKRGPTGRGGAPGDSPEGAARPTEAAARTATGGSDRAGTPEGGEVLPRREITLQKSNEPGAGEPGDSPGPAAPGGPEGRLLPLRGSAVLPEDFRIGPLEDRLAPSGAKQQILGVAASFLETLGDGSFPTDAVLPEGREELRRSLAYYIEQDLVPVRYRLGTIDFPEEAQDAESACLNLRLYGSPGIAEGELYLSVFAGRWYVADVQAGFPFLREPYEKKDQTFTPSVYGWRLQ
ncbi:MAG: hypothetical protein JW820_09715 [Spirochaetales bacterium]|nr:hypothetical protein [Spirochaetales bacterium]